MNVIPPPERESLLVAYLKKFRDPIIIILLVVFLLSSAIALYEVFALGRSVQVLIEPLGILLALLLATGVGFLFEVNAEKEFEVLNRVKDTRPVKVFRRYEGPDAPIVRIREIEKHDVCLGDYVLLESGDEVPADGLLDESNNLILDESNFTGEPYARKSAYAEEQDLEATFPSNKVLRGSTVIEGNAIFHVEAIGMHTIEGLGVMKTQEGSDVDTPLNQQLGGLSSLITRVSFVIATLIVVGRMLYFFFFDGNATNNHDWLEIAEFTLASVMLAVTLVVVAVPEGLPMSVTVSLALSMRRMLKENNLVRKLHACETMGATTVICTDKTGTLTQNKMTLVAHEFYGSRSDIEYNMALNSSAELSVDDNGKEKPLGNPTEAALLSWLRIEGVDYDTLRHQFVKVDGVAFSSERKYMITEVKEKASTTCIHLLKGAPEVVLDKCACVSGGQTKQHVLDVLHDYQAKAMRTLAFASRREDGGALTPWSFDGIVGIADPVREDVKDAIRDCTTKAGVRVVMVTGDTSGTANEIGRQIGLATEGMLSVTGAEFESLSDDAAMQLIADPNFKIISRARPDDKARLVTLFQRRNEVVAVTGDGTNDAPALSKAQVGLSMGDGTSRAKEASDITIIDNSFTSIVKAIVWGRSLYLNIQRFILFQLTINICACLIVLVGAFTGLDSPLNVTQMLWVNLIMDTFAAMALSSLPPDKSVLNEKPRDAKSHIINRNMALQIVLVGMFLFAFLLGLWQLLWHMDITSFDDLLHKRSLELFVSGFFTISKSKQHLSNYELSVFFTVFVMLQFWNLFNARYFRTSSSFAHDIASLLCRDQRTHSSFGWGFINIAFVILLGQVVIVTWFGQLFSVSPLSLRDWGWILLFTSPVLVVAEVKRAVVALLRRS